MGDTIVSTTASTSRAVAMVSAVVVASGKTLSADTIASTTASTSLAPSPTGTAVVVASGKTLSADTIVLMIRLDEPRAIADGRLSSSPPGKDPRSRTSGSTTALTSCKSTPTGASVMIAVASFVCRHHRNDVSAGDACSATTSPEYDPHAGRRHYRGAVRGHCPSKILALGAERSSCTRNT